LVCDTNSRNALIHGADLEADLTLFKYAVHYKKRLILEAVEKAFQEGCLWHGYSLNTRANVIMLDAWKKGRKADHRETVCRELDKLLRMKEEFKEYINGMYGLDQFWRGSLTSHNTIWVRSSDQSQTVE
jgi:hypothetical protein